MFRSLLAALLGASFSLGASLAMPYQAGVAQIADLDADLPAQATGVVWYPTKVPEIMWHAGPFRITASRDAPIVEGNFPIVLLSHGRQGGPLSHRDLAAHLAREGFIVIAPTHSGDSVDHPLASSQMQILTRRPNQAIAALDATLRDPRFSHHVDASRIGMVGYSVGGYTGLILAGAKPDFSLAAAYCEMHGRSDLGSCSSSDPTSEEAFEKSDWQPPSDPRLKALVLLDPLATMFDEKGLGPVKIPVMLYRPQDDTYMKSGANALALARSLHPSPIEITMPGRHFVFVDPCPEEISADDALVCVDEPGIDRAGLHRRLRREIAIFLKRNL